MNKLLILYPPQHRATILRMVETMLNHSVCLLPVAARYLNNPRRTYQLRVIGDTLPVVSLGEVDEGEEIPLLHWNTVILFSEGKNERLRGRYLKRSPMTEPQMVAFLDEFVLTEA